MFKSLYRMHRNTDRMQPEAVLTGKGAVVMLLIFLGEQLAAEGLSILTSLYGLPLGIMEINMIVNGGALVLMFLLFWGFFTENLKTFFKEFKLIYVWLPITCYFCSTIANLIIQIALAFVRGEFQNTSNNAIVIKLLYQYPIPLLLLTVLIAPITEEAIFRVLSIFLFSFFHIFQFAFFATDASGSVFLTFNLNEFLSILVYIPMAVGLTLCSFFGKNYWCSVLCHILTNGVAVFMLLIAGLVQK